MKTSPAPNLTAFETRSFGTAGRAGSGTQRMSIVPMVEGMLTYFHNDRLSTKQSPWIVVFQLAEIGLQLASGNTTSTIISDI
jgi:hypothetical protein